MEKITDAGTATTIREDGHGRAKALGAFTKMFKEVASHAEEVTRDSRKQSKRRSM